LVLWETYNQNQKKIDFFLKSKKIDFTAKRIYAIEYLFGGSGGGPGKNTSLQACESWPLTATTPCAAVSSPLSPTFLHTHFT
jgi:hypothetical protein